MIRLFRKKMERSCMLCMHSTQLDDVHVLCCKKGLRRTLDKCHKFKYDPCKRIPTKAKALDFDKYNAFDYSL